MIANLYISMLAKLITNQSKNVDVQINDSSKYVRTTPKKIKY